MDLPPISEFIELVKTTDEDADHRLPFLDQAAPVLYAAAACSESEREVLAEKLERWRYQRLNKFGGRLSDNERKLVTVLDLAVAYKKVVRRRDRRDALSGDLSRRSLLPFASARPEGLVRLEIGSARSAQPPARLICLS